MKNYTLITFFILSVLGWDSTKAQVNQSDSLALVALYNATGGGSWTNSWDLNQSVSLWSGVTLGGGRVTELILDQNNLVGTIPDLNLPTLRELFLNNNQLTGSIPNFSNLANLTRLELSRNQLTGSIPNFSNLAKLKRLELNNNQLTGSIPNFNNLPVLERMYLFVNQLSEKIPAFANLPQLTDLYIEENSFTFEDFLPSYNSLKSKLPGYYSYTYGKQDSIDIYQPAGIASGTNYTIDLVIDDSIRTNTYYWYKDATLIATIIGNNEYTIPNFQAADAGVYSAKIVNSIVSDTGHVFYDQNLILYTRSVTLSLTTGIHQLASSPLELYPNPVGDLLHINTAVINGDYQLELINMQGQVVEQFSSENNTTFLLPMADKMAGVYIVRLTNGDKVWQQKVVKR